jgi:hypothetical protein
MDDRLFDAKRYFEPAVQALETHRGYAEADGPGVKITGGDWNDWELIDWRATVKFSSGETLEILEIHSRVSGVHLRKIKYHFMDANRNCIFRVDTHGNPILFDDPCHLDLGPAEERIDDGDPRLGGQSMKGIGFWEILDWIHRYLDRTPLPWSGQ